MRGQARKQVTILHQRHTFSAQVAQPTAENVHRSLRTLVARQLLPPTETLRCRSHLATRENVMDENAGNLIRGLRQKLGMTQEEFAHEIAVTVSTVNRWENAHAEPSKLAWKAIEDLARKRGLNDDVLRRSGTLADS
jgi:DNA-binding transcriptional regulator YiaG